MPLSLKGKNEILTLNHKFGFQPRFVVYLSSLGVFRETFRNRNILVLTITQTLFMFTAFLWWPYRSLFILELGASKELLGMLLMVETVSSILFQLPGGILADRLGRRQIILISSALRIISPIIYLFSTTWIQITPALILASAGMLGMPAQTALIAESLPKGGRSSGFAAFRTITSIPMIITSLMGGVLMDYYGVLKGCRLVLMASIIMTVLSLVLRWKFITETLEKNQDSSFRGQSITEQVKGLGNLSRDIWVIIVVLAVSSFAARGVMSFMVIYGVEVVGLTKTQWGIIGTIVSVITTLLTTPSGILADRIGRKPLVIASRTFVSVSTLGYTFSENFTHMCITRGLGGIGSGLGGAMWGPMGGPVWQALVADLTPPSERAKIMGFIGTIGSIVSTPASWVGGYMYENISPALPFRASFILDTIGTVIFMFFLREPTEESVVLEGPDTAQREL